MKRALSVTCLAAVLVAFAAPAAHAGRSTIAILGLEVSDPGGQPTKDDVSLAKELTSALRSRAKLGAGPYDLAPNSERELIDEKLLRSCDSEATTCMLDIGKDVGGDYLLYGKLTKTAHGYQVSLQLLDVTKGVQPKRSLQQPLNGGASGTDLQEKAKQWYASITGQNTTGSLVVKIANGDRGTILIDRAEKGSITNGTGQVANVDEGKHKLRIEAEGYHPVEKDVTVTAGETQTVTITLEKREPPHGSGSGEGTVVSGSGTGPGGSGAGPGSGNPGNPGVETRRGSPGWKAAFIASTAVGLVAGGVWIFGYEETVSAENRLCIGGAFAPFTNAQPPSSCPNPTKTDPLNTTALNHENQRGDFAKGETIASGITVGLASAMFLIAGYEGFFAKHEQYPSEHADRGHRVHRERFVVTPVMSPNGAGATLRIDW